MSLILDALRKMEQERKSRRGASVNLRPEVLRYRGEIKRQKERSYLPVIAGLALIILGGGAGFLLKGHHGAAGPQNLAEAQSTADLPAAPQAAVAKEPAAPAPPVPSAPQSAPVAAQAAPPVAAVPQAAPVAMASVAAPATAEQPAVASRRARKATSPDSGAQARRPHTEAPQELGNVPDITVSGIAWQEERSLRRAVLNGSLVAEGAEVAGARVVEIKENRVRLSRGGQIFDVLFSSGLSSR